MSKVTVYTKNNCGQCEATKNLLNNRGVSFTEVNVEEDEVALNFVKSRGYQAVPVVVAEGQEDIVGFNINRLSQLN